MIDEVGRQLGDREFTASPAGYRALAAWLSQHGTLEMIGVEGTGTYGAGLARHLRTIGLTVVEVDRCHSQARAAPNYNIYLPAGVQPRFLLGCHAVGRTSSAPQANRLVRTGFPTSIQRAFPIRQRSLRVSIAQRT